jgi:hypothetical protein
MSAQDIANVAFKSGAAVLVTLSYWDNDPNSSYMVAIPQHQRADWTGGNELLAVLYDGVGVSDPKAPWGSKDSSVPPGSKEPGSKEPGSLPGDIAPDPLSDEWWQYDLNMNRTEREGALGILASKAVTVEGLQSVQYAALNCSFGHGPHPKFAAAIQKKIEAMGGVPAAPVSFPYTIKADGSDWPYSLAKTYTGDGNRWKEILPLNPNLKVAYSNPVPADPGTGSHDQPDGQKVPDDEGSFWSSFKMSGSSTATPTTTVSPWNAGQVIQLPISWKKG